MAADPSSEELTIRTGGKILGGWLASSVTRGVERLPSDFRIELTEEFPGKVGEVPVTPGTSCEVYLGGDKVLTGWIDAYAPSYSAGEHRVTIAGRSLCEDLVDCSALPPDGTTWQVNASTIGQAAKLICDPFGIAVSLPDGDAALDPSIAFIINPGMTCYQLIEELARSVQMLVWDNAAGNLVLSRVGTTRAASALVEGVNVEASRVTLRMDQRFSTIRVLGQVYDATQKGVFINSMAHAEDPQVPRWRPKILVIDPVGEDFKWAQQRANWEVSRRFGRSKQAVVTVTGWRDGAGTLWTPNTIVNAALPTLKIDDDLLIAQVSWKRDGRAGTTAELVLMPPEGFQPAPFIPPLFSQLAAGGTATPAAP